MGLELNKIIVSVTQILSLIKDFLTYHAAIVAQVFIYNPDSPCERPCANIRTLRDIFGHPKYAAYHGLAYSKLKFVKVQIRDYFVGSL